MEIYFDNSSTTAPYGCVCDAVSKAMAELYGNPSSLHRLGKKAEDFMEECRRTVAKSIGAAADEIIFTSGGTEGDNTAIIGYCTANRRNGNRIITSRTEHPAVLESFKFLEKNGFEAVYLDVDKNGVVKFEELKNALSDDTLLVSVMHVNNETGTIQPVREIADAVHGAGAVFHTDAVQSYGKIETNVKKTGADLLAVSAHKVHGPKGIGALYVKKGIRIAPLLNGGGQERGLRSSTENLPAIAGFARAAELICDNLPEITRATGCVKVHMAERIAAEIDGAVFNSPPDGVCSVLNVSFTGVKAEVLLHVLEDKGIYVSSGSACSSHKKGRSHVLEAMGVGVKEIDSALRFSFSSENTVEEADYAIDVLKEQVPVLRRIMR